MGQISVGINNHDTIDKIFGDKSIESAISELKGEPDGFRLSRQLLACERRKPGEDKKVENGEITHLGNCEIQILLGENLDQRVCVLRNNMLITTELDKLRVFRNMKDFVAIVECKSDAGTKLLRAMEPARHDSFDPDQFETEENVRRGALALRKMADWVRASLKKHAQIETSGGGAIDFLADLFQEEFDGGSGASYDRNPEGKLIFQPKPIKPPPQFTVPKDDEDGDEGGGGTGGGGGGGGNGGGSGDGGGDGGKGDKGGETAKKVIHLADVRAIQGAKNETQIYFTPQKGGKVDVRLFAIGADSEEMLKVISSKHGAVIDGAVQTTVVAGKRAHLIVKTARQSIGGLKVVASEV